MTCKILKLSFFFPQNSALTDKVERIKTVMVELLVKMNWKQKKLIRRFRRTKRMFWKLIRKINIQKQQGNKTKKTFNRVNNLLDSFSKKFRYFAKLMVGLSTASLALLKKGNTIIANFNSKCSRERI